MPLQKPQSLKDMQIEQGKQAMPYYNPMLQWAAQNAGLPMGQMGQPMGQMGQPMQQMGQPMAGFGAKGSPQMQFAAGQSAGQPMASTQPVGGMMGGLPSMSRPPQAGLQNSEMGIYGSNPADVYRMQQADEEINRISGQRARMLQHRLGQQGIGNSATMAAALGQNERSAMSDQANFRRQLAINAGPEQERRMQILMQMLGMGQQQGMQGQNVFAQQQQTSAQKPSALGQLAQFAPLFL